MSNDRTAFNYGRVVIPHSSRARVGKRISGGGGYIFLFSFFLFCTIWWIRDTKTGCQSAAKSLVSRTRLPGFRPLRSRTKKKEQKIGNAKVSLQFLRIDNPVRIEAVHAGSMAALILVFAWTGSPPLSLAVNHSRPRRKNNRPTAVSAYKKSPRRRHELYSPIELLSAKSFFSPGTNIALAFVAKKLQDC